MTRDTALSRRLGSLLNPEIAVVPAASCYAPPRALYFALSCVLLPTLFNVVSYTLATTSRRTVLARLATHGSIHGSKDTRQDAERDSTRMRVRSDFAYLLYAQSLLPVFFLIGLLLYLFSLFSILCIISYSLIRSSDYILQPLSKDSMERTSCIFTFDRLVSRNRIRDTREITRLINSMLNAIKQVSSMRARYSQLRISISGHIIRNERDRERERERERERYHQVIL